MSIVRLRRLRIRGALSAFLSLAMAVLLVAGCDESLGPAPGGAYPYTLHGFLNPRADTQAIRVFEVAELLGPVSQSAIDARVESTDRVTGETLVWRDSIVVIGDGDFRHVFWAPFRAAYGRTYRIEVSRSDGIVSRAEVAVAPETTLELLPPYALPGTNIVRQGVAWWNAPNIHDVKVHYRRRIESGLHTVGRDTLVVDYTHAKERMDGGWRVMVDFRKDAQLIKQPSNDIPGVTKLFNVEVRVLVASWMWSPPGGVFDAELHAAPGAFSNVFNGYGFVGGGYPDAIEWFPDEDVLRMAGLR